MRPTRPDGAVPHLTTQQMIEVDRAMVEDFGIELIQMMENAGRCLAHLARERFLSGDPRDRSVIVLAGTGGNGGGALVAARRLHGYGARVSVFLTKPDADLAPVPRHQLAIVRTIGIPVACGRSPAIDNEADLVVDGVIGYSLGGAPVGCAAELITWANAQNAPVLALDAPSGVDSTTGRAFEPAVHAAATMTLALPKEGLRAEGIGGRVGELYLADIGVPPELYAGLGLDFGHVFAHGDVIRLR